MFPALDEETVRRVTISVSVVTALLIVVLLIRRVLQIKNWKNLSYAKILLLLIYVDSLLFTTISALLQHVFHVNTSFSLCRTSIFICLVFIAGSKAAVILFLMERAYIVHNYANVRRLSHPLYRINIIICIPCIVLAVLNFVYRIEFIDTKGECYIGMQREVILPWVGYDMIINLYLTAVFLAAIINMHSFKLHKKSRLRTVALRSAIGVIGTTIVLITNSTISTIENGERVWTCFLSCNLEVLATALILHWVTSPDKGDNQIVEQQSPINHIDDIDLEKDFDTTLVTLATFQSGTLIDGKAFDGLEHGTTIKVSEAPPVP